MRIGIIYDALYPDIIGGAEKRNWDLARTLVLRGHQVTLITMNHWQGESQVIRDGVTIDAVAPFYPLFRPNGGRTLLEPHYFGKHVGRYLRHRQFDLIDCTCFPYTAAMAVARVRPDIPLVITWHEVRGIAGWMQYSGLAGIPAWLLERYCSGISTYNLASSELTRQRATGIYPHLARTLRYIPVGINIPVLPALAAPAPPQRLFTFGRLEPHKRIEWVIDAVARLRETHPQVDAVIVGDGSERERLMQKAAAIGLSDRIRFCSFLERQELLREMVMATVGVFPSAQEGFGISMLEAMGAGLPVVVADTPLSAAGSLIHDGTDGLLCTDFSSFVGHIRRLLDEPDTAARIARNGRETAAAYRWEVMADVTETYYSECIARHVDVKKHTRHRTMKKETCEKA